MLSVQRLQRALRQLQSTDLAKYIFGANSLRSTDATKNDHDSHHNASSTLVQQSHKRYCYRTQSHASREHQLLPADDDENHQKDDDGKTISSKFLAASLFSNSVDGSNHQRDNNGTTTTSCERKDSTNLAKSEIMSTSENGSADGGVPCDDTAGATTTSTTATNSKACFKSSFADIVQFLELVGSLKHTKRTGWVLRDVPDCESISGHMYRMSLMTFLLDGTEGLNQIRCMELALVHDLAESLVGDITPFCGVSKEDKKALELKAMEEICNLIEPRGKRIMELFEEYETAESPESKFVKDLDRLDMVMQAFEYEKRDNCVLKHQEFFDSTHGKFNHPFVIKLVNEIHDQRRALAIEKGVQSADQASLNGFHEPDGSSSNEKTTSSS